MASDLIPQPATEESDEERFAAGRATVAAAFKQLDHAGDAYSDAFAQQIVHDRVEGRVRRRDGSIPPIHVSAVSNVSEGMAFRRLFEDASFAAANGFDPTLAASLTESVTKGSELSLTVRPDAESRVVPSTFGDNGAAYVREIVDAILSSIEQSITVTARISTLRIRKALINSLGHDETTEVLRTELHVRVETDLHKASTTWVDWGSTGLPAIHAAGVARHFDSRFDGVEERRSEVPARVALLLPSGWGGVWMHEAVGHPAEADTYFSKGSPLYGMLGESVSSASVSIVDDGRLAPSRVQSAFDDEGVETKRTQVIDRGILVGVLTDRRTATAYGLPLSGNGRRPHFGLPPRPRMTNLLLEPGGTSSDALSRLADPMIVVEEIRRARLDGQNFMLHLEIDEGTLLQGGERAGRIGRFIVSAPTHRLLANIVGVADDFSVDLNRGYCMKDGAAIPVTVGQPAVVIKDLKIRPADS